MSTYPNSSSTGNDVVYNNASINKNLTAYAITGNKLQTNVAVIGHAKIDRLEVMGNIIEDSTGTLIGNYFLTPYVVGLDVGDPYSDVQSAVDDATTDGGGTVLVKHGFYGGFTLDSNLVTVRGVGVESSIITGDVHLVQGSLDSLKLNGTLRLYDYQTMTSNCVLNGSPKIVGEQTGSVDVSNIIFNASSETAGSITLNYANMTLMSSWLPGTDITTVAVPVRGNAPVHYIWGSNVGNVSYSNPTSSAGGCFLYSSNVEVVNVGTGDTTAGAVFMYGCTMVNAVVNTEFLVGINNLEMYGCRAMSLGAFPINITNGKVVVSNSFLESSSDATASVIVGEGISSISSCDIYNSRLHGIQVNSVVLEENLKIVNCDVTSADSISIDILRGVCTISNCMIQPSSDIVTAVSVGNGGRLGIYNTRIIGSIVVDGLLTTWTLEMVACNIQSGASSTISIIKGIFIISNCLLQNSVDPATACSMIDSSQATGGSGVVMHNTFFFHSPSVNNKRGINNTGTPITISTSSNFTPNQVLPSVGTSGGYVVG